MKKLLLTTLFGAIISLTNAQVDNTNLVANYFFEQNTNAHNNVPLNGTVNGTVSYDTKNGSALKISNTLGSTSCNGTWQPQCIRFSKGGCLQYQQVCVGSLTNIPTSNNYVSLPLSDTVIKDKFTISFWLNPTNTNVFVWNNIFSKRLNRQLIDGKTVLYNSINISVYNATTLNAGISTLNDTEVNLTTPISTAVWTYITFTYDGSKIKLYKNGVLASEANITGNINFDSQFQWVLGQMSDKDNAQGGNFMIDDLYIFSKALSAQEVVSLQSSGITGLEDNVLNQRYVISPNPANDYVNLPAFGQIFDLLGNKVAEGVGNVSVSGLHVGVYLVKIGVQTEKLVIK